MLSCLGEWHTVSAASILFPWMQSVHLIFLRFVLTQWIIIAPWKPAHHKSIGLTYPQIRLCNNPTLLPRAWHRQANTYTHACNVLTLRLICWHDAKQHAMVLCNPAYFNVFWGTQTCCIYRENSRGSHSLTGCRWGRFPFHDNLLCWNDIWNTWHQTWIYFTYSNVLWV